MFMQEAASASKLACQCLRAIAASPASSLGCQAVPTAKLLSQAASCTGAGGAAGAAGGSVRTAALEAAAAAWAHCDQASQAVLLEVRPHELACSVNLQDAVLLAGDQLCSIRSARIAALQHQVAAGGLTLR